MAVARKISMSHPVRLLVEPPAEPRNRLTALLRPILVIPHALLVGGPFVGLGGGCYRIGALGAVALLAALLDWFAVLFTGRPIAGLQPFKLLYLRWRTHVLAYSAFLRDEYPPFGDAAYPATLVLPEPALQRDRALVLLRPLTVIPHLVVLFFLLVAWAIAALISWAYLVVTARLPPALWRFGRDVMAYALKVEAFALLVHDEFPPFVFTEESASATAEPDAGRPA
jgi:hypothetical protein